MQTLPLDMMTTTTTMATGDDDDNDEVDDDCDGATRIEVDDDCDSATRADDDLWGAGGSASSLNGEGDGNGIPRTVIRDLAATTSKVDGGSSLR